MENENIIALGQIYSVTKIETPVEIYYIACLARYLNKEGYILSLDGIDLSEYEDSYYFDYLCYYSENITGYNFREGKLPEGTSRYEYDFSKQEVIYREKTHIEWVFDFKTDKNYKNLSTFKGICANDVYVNFLAYITVSKLLYSTPKKLVLDFQNADIYVTKTSNNWDIVNLYLLSTYTKALDNWVDIKLPNDGWAVAQLGYEAFYSDVVYRNGERDYIPTNEKIGVFKQKFQIGDVCFLYKRNSGRATDTNKTIESCKIAIIKSVSREGVTLIEFSGAETPLTVKKRIQSMPDRIQKMYSEDYYKKLNSLTTTYSWIDLGVEQKLYLEEQFITDLNCADEAELWFEKNGEEFTLELDCADAVYSILCEYGVDFNRERFEKLYFSDKKSRYITEVVNG